MRNLRDCYFHIWYYLLKKKNEMIKAYFTKFDNKSNWVDGMVGKYNFQAKLFDTGSIFGINDGRVSKLAIYYLGVY